MKKIIGMFVLMLLITAALPVISSESTYKIDIDKNEYLKIEHLTVENAVEISIFGTLYMIINRPLGETTGLYAKFRNIGQDDIDSYFGYHIKSISTSPMDFPFKTEDSLILPSGSLAEMVVALPLGFGLFKFTCFIEGAGENEGFYAEKSASGICLNFYAFVITSSWIPIKFYMLNILEISIFYIK